MKGNKKNIAKKSKKDIKKTKVVKSKLKYVIVRTGNIEVLAGNLEKRTDHAVTLLNAIGLDIPGGLFDLYKIAMQGFKNPEKLKFSCQLNRIEVIPIEILDVTEKAEKSIKDVSIWESKL